MRRLLLLCSAASLLFPSTVLALDLSATTSRSLAMGGTGVASARGPAAARFNPALLGYPAEPAAPRGTVGGVLSVSAGARALGQIADAVDRLSDIDPKVLDQGVATDAQAAELVDLVGGLAALEDPSSALLLEADGGLALRWGRLAIGSRGYGAASLRLSEVDTVHLGLDAAAGTLSDQLAALPSSGGDGSLGFFNLDQQAQLAAAGLDAAAIAQLDYLARQNELDPELAGRAAELLGTVESATGRLEDNTTAVQMRAVALAEVPLSFGYALGQHFSLGATARLIQGRVYGQNVRVFGRDAEAIIKSAEDAYEETTTVGLDVGAAWRHSGVTLAVVGRNLNTPTLDGPTEGALRFADVELQPSWSAAVEFAPLDSLHLAVDYDLQPSDTLLDGYEQQRLALGAEWAPGIVALRAGAFTNLKDSDFGWTYTAGLALEAGPLRLEVAGAANPDTVVVDGEEIPREARAGIELALAF